MQALLAAYKKSGKGPQHASFEDFQLVQLDQPVKIDGLTLIENLDTKPERISFTNCYFHDGMNCGIARALPKLWWPTALWSTPVWS